MPSYMCKKNREGYKECVRRRRAYLLAFIILSVGIFLLFLPSLLFNTMSREEAYSNMITYIATVLITISITTMVTFIIKKGV